MKTFSTSLHDFLFPDLLRQSKPAPDTELANRGAAATQLRLPGSRHVWERYCGTSFFEDGTWVFPKYASLPHRTSLRKRMKIYGEVEASEEVEDIRGTIPTPCPRANG